ncbi:MAG: efflux RND transporter periplasmic adaptor subunit [Acidobacteria bacterium]|nr:efflux RND transporter periplasmic adaptor subunit [Acidobacteriota bacterium]
MKRLLWLIALGLIGYGAWYVQRVRNAPPEVAFTKPRRERLVSKVSTNGKVEPIEWHVIRSPREGALLRFALEKGQHVAQGAVIAELDSSEAQTELRTAEAKIAQAKAELAVLNQGGRARDMATIDGDLDRARLELAAAQKLHESLQRLVAKNAAPRVELDQAAERIRTATANIASLEKQRASLVTAPDRASAQARLQEAETTADAARRRISHATVVAPASGTVYQVDVRKGAYLRPGDAIASIGKLDRVRVAVFIDEPELGAIKVGQTVTITWDALPGAAWTGSVEKLPSQITALNSRQVGEVVCIIDNRDGRLLAQTNINAEIQTQAVENALTIPKEVLRREKTEAGVIVLQPDGTVAFRKIVTGAASVTRIEVKEGLQEGDQVALPTDSPLRDGTKVKPVPATEN